MNSILLFLVLIPPFVSFALNGLIPSLRKSKKGASGLSIFSIFVSTLASFALLLKNPEVELLFEWIPGKMFSPIHFGFFLDPFAVVMLFIVALVALMVQAYSLGYMSEENPSSFGRYYTFHSLFAFSMLGFVASSSLLQAYIFWELVGLCSYLLIGFWYHRPEAARAAVKAFWITRFGDVGFAIGMVLLWGATGTFLLSELFVKAPELSSGYLSLCLLLIFFGAMGKSAQFPLHVWLPDAMEGPTPVSALIHAATMVVAGVYLVIRLFPLFQFTPEVLSFVTWIGSITALIGASLALIQEDIKRILAYSTVSQIGYMMAVAGAAGKAIAFFHLFTHAFFKALLFLAAGSIIHALRTNNIWEMGKLAKKMPQTTILFLTGALALSGIFPFSGYFSKDEILIWMYAQGFTAPFFVLLFTAFLTAFYMFRVFFVAFMGDKEAKEHPHESPWVMTLPMWILGLFTLGAGFPKEALFKFLGYDSESYHSYFLAYLPSVISIFGIGTAWSFYERKFFELSSIAKSLSPITLVLEKKLWLDDIYEWFYMKVLDGLSFLCGWFDRYIVDGFVNATSWSIRQVSRGLREIQTGRIQDYLYGIIAALILLIWLALGVFPNRERITEKIEKPRDYIQAPLIKDSKKVRNKHD
jgi:NADH-quinone oxidoreductase subunit L